MTVQYDEQQGFADEGESGYLMEIKLPRVKVEVREDEGVSLGKLSPALIVGFGAH